MAENRLTLSSSQFFVIIVVGSLLSALLGGAFGALVATISPEFVKSLFGADVGQSVVRYSFAVGMIWGVFIGAAVSGFAKRMTAFTRMAPQQVHGGV